MILRNNVYYDNITSRYVHVSLRASHLRSNRENVTGLHVDNRDEMHYISAGINLDSVSRFTWPRDLRRNSATSQRTRDLARVAMCNVTLDNSAICPTIYETQTRRWNLGRWYRSPGNFLERLAIKEFMPAITFDVANCSSASTSNCFSSSDEQFIRIDVWASPRNR